MGRRKYKLRILPLFEQDLNEIVDYIAFHLKSPQAAEDFVEEVEKAIQKVLKDGYRTVDIMSEGQKEVSCSMMGNLIVERL